VLLSKLSRLERRAPEVLVSWTGSSGELHWKFRSLAPVRVRVRVFCSGILPEVLVLTGSSGQAPEVPIGAVCVRVRVREICPRFHPEVLIRTGSSGPDTRSSGGPELTDKPNGLISFDRKFRWLPPELPVAHPSPSI
jgi:hypothetical protein